MSLVGKRTGNYPKLEELLVAVSRNLIYVMRENEFRIKHYTEVTHRTRKGYVREQRE